MDMGRTCLPLADWIRRDRAGQDSTIGKADRLMQLDDMGNLALGALAATN